jgi:predicted transcriptional regulator
MCMQEKVGKRRARLVRKQLMLTGEQNAHLKRIAAATSRSEGELVREAVDDWLSRQKAEQEDWKAAWRQAAGLWADREDIDEIMAERREARRLRRERMNARTRGGRG